MSTTIQVRDVIQPPAEWYAWIHSPERAAAMRRSGQDAGDSVAGDTGTVFAPDGFLRTRDVVTSPSQQGGTAAVLDLRNPHATMNERQRAGGFLPGDPGREAGAKTAKAADGAGAGEVLDLRHPAIAAQRLRSGVGR
jgi:hypothetical protein